MTAGLSLAHLTKRYAAATPTRREAQAPAALDDLSLDVPRGELLAVVGPSGCGKSTLLRLLAGLEEESSGEMRLEGQRLNGMPPGRRDVALMFQNHALFPHLTVGANMAFGLRVRGASRDAAEREVRDVAERLGLANLLARMPHEVSGGERQRAALGRALLRRPRLFLFDEPLSSLDAALRADLRAVIGRLHREQGATMVFVTHDQTEALTLGMRVAVLDRGRLQQVADPDTLYREPKNRFVAGFIGNPGMNFLDAGCTREGETWVIRHPDMTSPLALPSDVARAHPRLRPGPVTVGLRPEDLAVSSDQKAPCGLRGGLSFLERLGGSILLYLQGETTSFIVRLGAAPGLRGSGLPAPGENLVVTPDWTQARLFDAATGESLQ